MLQRVWAVAQKEFIAISRERTTLIIVLSLPLLELFLFAYAVHTDISDIPTIVADQSMDPTSRSYLDAMVQSGYFQVVATTSGQAGVMRAIDDGEARMGIVIPPDFASHVTRGDAQVLLLVDGSDSFTTLSAYNSANVIAEQYVTTLEVNRLARAEQSIVDQLNPLTAHVEVLYNPDIKDLWFLIPGLIAWLLQASTMMLTALAVVREREVGTIEQILVTPIRPFELMLGKAVPNLAIAVINMASIFIVGVIGFGVPFKGNMLLFIALTLLYAVAGLGMGLLISSVCHTQRQANQMTLMVNLIAQFVSGFIFPRYAMPVVLQAIGDIFPLTYFIPIARGIFTKGIGMESLWGPTLMLVLWIVVILFFASRLFRQKLD